MYLISYMMDTHPGAWEGPRTRRTPHCISDHPVLRQVRFRAAEAGPVGRSTSFDRGAGKGEARPSSGPKADRHLQERGGAW